MKEQLNVLLIGFGDLARRLTPRLLASGCKVSGLRRSSEVVSGVKMISGDCRDRQLLATTLTGQDAVVVSLTPGEFTEQSYQDTYVASACALADTVAAMAVKPKLILWVSSTSVYGQHQGEWVDESSPTQPKGFSGRYLLEAEHIIASGSVPATVVRFSGIYGPGRTRLVEQARRGQSAAAEPVQWTNRIHSEDCAGVLHHLLLRGLGGASLAPLYIGTDCAPVPLHEVQQWLAAQLGVTLTDVVAAGPSRGNRRCSNALLLGSGYKFLYPTYRDGYGALLAGEPDKAE